MSGFERHPADNGAPNTDVFDLHRVNCQWVVFQDREIGGFAALDRAELIIEMQLICGSQRDGVER